MFTANGVLRLDDWNNIEGIFDNVRCINECYYDKILENLKYIEAHDKEIYTAYSIELRDAYAHLVKVLAYNDISSEDNKIKINRQLERYLGHLEEMLYDTYLRNIKSRMDSLYKKLEGKIDLPKKKMEYAQQILQVRTVKDDNTIAQKIANYEKIIESIKMEDYQVT
jgi:hypothetical protein